MPFENSSKTDLLGLRLANKLLSPKARRAIGNRPIWEVWDQFRERYWRAAEDHWEESKELLASYDLKSVDLYDLIHYTHPGRSWDMEEVGERAALRLNALVRHNPDLDWSNIPKWHPLQAVTALLGWLKPEWHHYKVPEDEDDQ
jgi:hypothetical protein